ncbi:MAG: hypothetical protein CMJ86_10660 [Planctomycetes bacterium]|jgi:hypothetical protein|nr:hypothetical protein [Planctomycetota bacterium]
MFVAAFPMGTIAGPVIAIMGAMVIAIVIAIGGAIVGAIVSVLVGAIMIVLVSAVVGAVVGMVMIVGVTTAGSQQEVKGQTQDKINSLHRYRFPERVLATSVA